MNSLNNFSSYFQVCLRYLLDLDRKSTLFAGRRNTNTIFPCSTSNNMWGMEAGGGGGVIRDCERIE